MTLQEYYKIPLISTRNRVLESLNISDRQKIIVDRAYTRKWNYSKIASDPYIVDTFFKGISPAKSTIARECSDFRHKLINFEINML